MKKKYISNTLITIGLYVLFVLFVYYAQDSVIAKDHSDYINQHTMFIDYIRRNFWASGDFFPQWNMNYGLGQSFVTLFYYGMYNPFVMLAYVLPPVNPVFFIEFIFIILLGLNTLGMTKLLALNKIEGRTNTAVAVLSSFSGIFILHNSTHPMFVYYLPIMTLSLVALHYLADSKIKSYYAITVALIFFTNFTFAPMISTLQFFYYTGLLVERKQFKVKSYVRFFKAYLTGVLTGMLILIPIGLFVMLGSSRTETVATNIDLFNSYSYILNSKDGIYIIGLMAVLGSLFVTRRKKYYIVLIPMLLALIFQPINFAFNLFEYVHTKVYIMFVPLYWLMFAELAKRGNKFSLGMITLVSTIMFVIPKDLSAIELLIFITLSLAIYVMLVFDRLYVTLAIVVTLAVANISTHVITAPRSELSEFTNADGTSKSQIDEYRTLDSKNNHLDTIYTQVPNIYTSLENDNYIQAVRLEYETAISWFVRQTKDYAFDNLYYQNMFALENDLNEPNPIVYGVNNDDVYSLEVYQSLDKDEKLYAANQAIFVSDASQMDYTNNFNLEPLYTSDQTITISSDGEFEYPIPSQYQDGVLSISFDANLEQNASQRQKININGIINEAMYQDGYGINDNSRVTFRINTQGQDMLKMKISMVKDKPIDYTNFRVSYQSLADFEDNKLQVIGPENFVADMNNSYTFDLTLDADGYLATTIPYDRGFDIYVDGEQVPVEKIDDLYIGAKLPAGTHQVVIEYHIPGFIIGLLATTIGWLIIGYMFITERHRSHKRKLS